jgi:hypothetical protein
VTIITDESLTSAPTQIKSPARHMSWKLVHGGSAADQFAMTHKPIGPHFDFLLVSSYTASKAKLPIGRHCSEQIACGNTSERHNHER